MLLTDAYNCFTFKTHRSRK